MRATKVIQGTITSGFGNRTHPVTGAKSFHNGIDIAAPIGTAVYSPSDGIVKSRYDHQRGGLTVIIGTNDKRFGFCHLNKILVNLGEAVKEGQKIAESGNTGASTGSHLHFSVMENVRWIGNQHVGGAYVEPTKYVAL